MKPSVCLALAITVSAASQSSSFASQGSQCRPTYPGVTRAQDGRPSLFPSRLNMSHPTTEADISDSKRMRSNENGSGVDRVTNMMPSGVGDNHGTNRSRALVAGSGLTALSAVILAAKLGVVPGMPLADGTFDPYTDSMIAQDAGATLLSFGLAYGFVKTITELAKNGVLESRDSRKIIHTFSAPLFILVWPIFSAATGARFFAGIVPIVNGLRLYLAASGRGEEKELANAVSRSGDAREALGGPFLYVIILASAVLLFWRESLTGLVAISTMAAGDGLADIIGRRFGKNNKWPFSRSKSVAGSTAFVVASTLASTGLVAWMSYTGCLSSPLPLSELFPRIAAISVACAGVELLPIGDDNWTVPLSAAVLSLIFLY